MVTYQFSSSQGSFAWFVDQPSRCKRPCKDFFPPEFKIIISFTIKYRNRRNFWTKSLLTLILFFSSLRALTSFFISCLSAASAA